MKLLVVKVKHIHACHSYSRNLMSLLTIAIEINYLMSLLTIAIEIKLLNVFLQES